MRTLFAKILLWFWSTLAITVVGSAFISAIIVNRDASIGGVALTEGSTVIVQLTDSGADPSLAFGVGVHRCLGVRLALLEATVAVEEVVAELPAVVAIEESPPMLDLLSFQAPRRVLVERRVW